MTRPVTHLLALLVLLFAENAVAQSLVTFERSKLVVAGESGRHGFDVELAVSPDQRAQGLMYRAKMPADAGMLFDFGASPQRVSMWMKNTKIPLDMLFITGDGRIESISERTVPYSLETISSRGPVRAVLELNSGTVSRLGIVPGDRVEHPIFSVD